MDPFVALSVAAALTRGLKLTTGVCLVIQRDTIQTAKLVGSLDQISTGRLIFGIGGGWNAEEMEDHGTPHPPIIVGGAFRYAARTVTSVWHG